MKAAAILLLIQYIVEAVILKGCGQKEQFDSQQLQNLSISDIQQKVLGGEACCPSKAVGGYFFHVPKCGGTSVRKMLQNYLQAAGLKFCMHVDNVMIAGSAYYNCIDSIEGKKRYLKQIYRGRFLKECNVIASHNDVTLLDRLDSHNKNGKKQLLDIIVLREPVERQLSELKFVHVQIPKRNISALQNKLLKPEFLDWMENSGDKMTKMLSGFWGCYDLSLQNLRTGGVDDYHLKKAIINLSQFCVIIIMEQPKCGLARLASVYNYQNTTYLQYPHSNPGLNYQWDTDYLHKANVSNLQDKIVYQYALELNKQQCTQLNIDPHTSSSYY